MLAVGAPVALAQSEGSDAGKAAERARQRAEDLAEAASRRFGEVMKEEQVAQAQSKQPAAPSPGPAAGGDPWTATMRWLEYSDREYRSIMRKLALGGSAAPAPPAPAPATKPTTPPAEVAGKPAPSEQSEDWLTRSSQRFQSIMRKLTEGAAPPPKSESVAEPKPTPAKPPEFVPCSCAIVHSSETRTSDGLCLLR
jgi:hypothetical protein